MKDNQPKLMAAIETYFLDHPERDLKDLEYRCHETREGTHGRLDERLICAGPVCTADSAKVDGLIITSTRSP